MLGQSGADEESLEKIRSILGGSVHSIKSNHISLDTTEGEHSAPRFKKKIYEQMYNNQLQTFKKQLAQGGQPDLYQKQQWAFYKKAIDKMYSKYMVYDGKAERTLAVLTTQATTTKEQVVNSVNRIPADTIAVVGTGELPDE